MSEEHISVKAGVHVGLPVQVSSSPSVLLKTVKPNRNLDRTSGTVALKRGAEEDVEMADTYRKFLAKEGGAAALEDMGYGKEDIIEGVPKRILESMGCTRQHVLEATENLRKMAEENDNNFKIQYNKLQNIPEGIMTDKEKLYHYCLMRVRSYRESYNKRWAPRTNDEDWNEKMDEGTPINPGQNTPYREENTMITPGQSTPKPAETPAETPTTYANITSSNSILKDQSKWKIYQKTTVIIAMFKIEEKNMRIDINDFYGWLCRLPDIDIMKFRPVSAGQVAGGREFHVTYNEAARVEEIIKASNGIFIGPDGREWGKIVNYEEQSCLLRVQGLPQWISNETLSESMKKLVMNHIDNVRVVKCEQGKTKSPWGDTIPTLYRQMVLIVPRSFDTGEIPSFIEVEHEGHRYKAMITLKGVHPRCFNCNQRHQLYDEQRQRLQCPTSEVKTISEPLNLSTNQENKSQEKNQMNEQVQIQEKNLADEQIEKERKKEERKRKKTEERKKQQETERIIKRRSDYEQQHNKPCTNSIEFSEDDASYISSDSRHEPPDIDLNDSHSEQSFVG